MSTYFMIWWRVSSEGGVGRSGGKCGKSEGINSGWELNRGAMFAGVRMSVRDSPVDVRAWISKLFGDERLCKGKESYQEYLNFLLARQDDPRVSDLIGQYHRKKLEHLKVLGLASCRRR